MSAALSGLDRTRRLLDAPPPPTVPGQLAVDDRPRIGSLCSGYGGLDMAVCDVLGASVAWHCQYDPDDKHQYAARILAHHWPDVPNHGDVTAVDWSTVEPVDVLTAGFPCQDVSLAGLRAGLAEGTRSGLWAHVARALSVLRPRLAVIENVPGLLSAPAARGLGPDGTPLDEGDTPGTLRALGAVLGDLADLGFDAEWGLIPASAVLAPHQRKRVFLLAWPAADANGKRGNRAGGPGREPQRHLAGPSREPATDTAGVGRSEGRRVPDGGERTARTGGEGEPSRSGTQRVPGEAVEWGQYGPAVTRWETVTGRTAPRPTDDRGRLTPAFVEWMMGLPTGHVTAVPGLSRPAQLKALGNGVVPPQAAYAVRYLLHRAGIATRFGPVE
ncbi:DNA cytosine methyltransferase [Streptomyces iconiensis]|uniref:DNA (cytosine-5-)-methyltransferase n=1 Tax=Streptomyces iconiensis TaxID=1384038 RepID=A0ABT6ZRQ3_9ACTN|nr:DNA cytosine methyltransferase [Streptomyces iconiensis]MDJ1131748.1 DNA cytosine methyltransferase [Streptomyces iconiensis]